MGGRNHRAAPVAPDRDPSAARTSLVSVIISRDRLYGTTHDLRDVCHDRQRKAEHGLRQDGRRPYLNGGSSPRSVLAALLEPRLGPRPASLPPARRIVASFEHNARLQGTRPFSDGQRRTVSDGTDHCATRKAASARFARAECVPAVRLNARTHDHGRMCTMLNFMPQLRRLGASASRIRHT